MVNSPLLLVLPLAAALLSVAHGKGFLVERRTAGRGGLEALATALGEAMGCGGHVTDERLAAIESQLRPIWLTLPKNGEGNVERRSLRYLVNRHFGRSSALQIRGFEPTRAASAAGWGDADILAQRVPAFVEAFLESSHKLEKGFSLADAVKVVATIEQLIFDTEGTVLEVVYKDRGLPLDQSLDREGAASLLEHYMMCWMLGADEEVALLSANRTMLQEIIPHWDQIVAFARGQVDALEYKRRQAPALSSAARTGHNALDNRHSYEDVHDIVGGITRSFASFWDSECRAMKASLVEMDVSHTGRVPLSKFYSHGLDAEWRFGESEDYLRELGALDETSYLGKQVIIPNYIQATSNCIVSTDHYLVCCVNDCEPVLEDIEAHIGTPTASPEAILAAVANVTSISTTLDEEYQPQLLGSLATQLELIASAHGGQVPLHGRLFAQWLHYAFPRECPFPHKTGAVATTTPSEFGSGYIASKDEMKAIASLANSTDLQLELHREDLQWMSQWSEEEELIADYSAMGLHAPWERRSGLKVAGGLFAVLAAAGLLLGGRGAGSSRKGGASAGDLFAYEGKAHFV